MRRSKYKQNRFHQTVLFRFWKFLRSKKVEIKYDFLERIFLWDSKWLEICSSRCWSVVRYRSKLLKTGKIQNRHFYKISFWRNFFFFDKFRWPNYFGKIIFWTNFFVFCKHFFFFLLTKFLLWPNLLLCQIYLLFRTKLICWRIYILENVFARFLACIIF